MNSFSSEELIHERLMQEDGADRYRALSLKARGRGALTLLPPGRALVRRSLDGVRHALVAYLKHATRLNAAAPYLRKVDLHAAALLALTVVVDGLHRSRLASTLAGSIGRALEDEVRFREFSRLSPGLWKEVLKRTKHSGPKFRRKAAIGIGRKSDSLPPAWPIASKIGVGLACIEAVRAATGIIEVRNIQEGKRRKLYVTPSAEALVWFEKADERAAMIQPLYRPTLDVPLDWEGVEGGGYLTDLVLRRPIFRSRSKGHLEYVRAQDPESYRPMLTALNRLQGVAWKVNAPILETMSHCLDLVEGPLAHIADDPLPVKPADISENEEARKEWRREAGRTRAQNFRKRSARILVGRTLDVAESMRLHPRFHFPHRLDFRGRAYPIPVWMQPQGPDVARGLLSFAEDTPMTPEGWAALMDYGEELGGFGHSMGWYREVAKAVYMDPWETREWVEAKKPVQFLAWCLEVGLALECGYPQRPFLTSLPVHIDARQNGLQLFALMTGDRDLARRTNCLPGPLQDLYKEVAALACERLAVLAESGESRVMVGKAGARESYDPAAEWDRIFDGEIPRDCAKKPVMVRTYNVTLWSATDYVLDWYRSQYDPQTRGEGPLAHPGHACRFLADLLMSSVDTLCPGAVIAMNWLQEGSDLCSSRGVPTKWTTPAGWPILQDYRQVKDKRVRALLGGAVRRVRISEERGKADRKRQVNGVAPNFNHGVDSSVMAFALKDWEHPITAVHDSFGTLAPFVPTLKATLLQAVVDVTIKHDPLLAFKEEIEGLSGLTFSPPPRFGVISPEEVLAATNLFG